jgi:AcrR family transcriptional regulator
MAPKTKGQFEEIRQEKRELILETALEVFAVHGFHGASISMIAQKAGIAKGLMYNYFESKEELLKAIIDKGLKDALGVYTPLFENKITEDQLTPEMFRDVFKKFFIVIKENMNFWRLYYAIVMQPGIMEMVMKDYEGMMITHLELLEKYYKKQGSKNPRADALHANILFDGLMVNLIQPHKEFTTEELEELVLNGLEKPLH